MDYPNITYLLLFSLVVLQSIVGVGLLVVGTPMLLIFGMEFTQILSILLPLSILTSLVNLVFLRFKRENLDIKIEKDLNILFFLVCLPFIFVGLYLVKNFENLINFKYLVSSVIIFSLIISNQKKIFIPINNKLRIFFLSIIGMTHGISNSGGTLLSLFISSNFNKNQSRYNITYFYFFLALFQFMMFLFIFKINFNYLNIFFAFVTIPIGALVGNLLSDRLSNFNFKFIVNFLCFVACLILLATA